MRVFRSTDPVVRDATAAGKPAILAAYLQDAGSDVQLGIAHVPASPRNDDRRVSRQVDTSQVQAGRRGFWERHDAGDEVLIVLAGRATFTATTAAGPQTLDVEPGDVLHVPAGTGHSAEVHEALEIVFLLPANCTTTWYE